MRAMQFILFVMLMKRYRRGIRGRHYLTRPSIPLVCHSAATILLEERDDRSFVNRMGVDVRLFDDLHEMLIQRFPDLCGRGGGRPKLLSTRMQLALTLQFLRSRNDQSAFCQIFGASPFTVSNTLSQVLPSLLRVLAREPDARIQYPDHDEMGELADLVSANHPDIPYGIFGFIDGLVLPILNNGDPVIQNAYYNGYKGTTTITNIAVFAPDGTIIYASINHPGNYHDSRAAGAIYRLVNDVDFTPDPYKLLGDSAFPSVTQKIITLKKRNQFSADPNIREDEKEMQSLLSSARQTVEWGMRVIQGTFQRLHVPLKSWDTRYNYVVIRLCLHLCNIRTRRMGMFNQILTVFSQHIDN